MPPHRRDFSGLFDIPTGYAYNAEVFKVAMAGVYIVFALGNRSTPHYLNQEKNSWDYW